MKLVLEKEAISALKSICSYIEESSETRARRVRKIVMDSIGELRKNPFKYPPDKYYKKNEGSVRAYEIMKLRITYSVSETQITILGIRHTKRNPTEY